LIAFLKNYAETVRRTYTLARPYGRKKLLTVGILSFAQAFFQVVGVTSIFPFLALASDPSRLRDSRFGSEILSWLPPMDDARMLLVAGLFAIVMLIVANLFNVIGEYVRNQYASHFAHWLRLELIHKIVSRPYGDFLQENTGILLKKILGDVGAFSNGVLLNILDTFTRLATALLLLGTLFLVQPQIAMSAALGLTLFYSVLYRSLSGWRNRTSDALKKANGGAFVNLQQLLAGIKPVKVHRGESHFIGCYASHSKVQARLNALLPMVGSLPRYLIEPLAFGGLVVAVMVYIARGQDFTTILPNLGVMALAGYRLLPAIQLLYGQLSSLGTTRHSLEEVYDEFHIVENAKNLDHGSSSGRFSRLEAIAWQHQIRIENLSFQYSGAVRPVLENFNLIIPKNSSLGIVGQTGSGKSTLVDLLLGLHIPKSGCIRIDDMPLSAENRRAWRAGIGYVPQEIYLIDHSITANIAFGISEAEVDLSAVRRAAAAAQILDFIDNELPKGFDTVVGERGVRLSGGQRQRIGLARALYHQPDLLILDEATSALDMETEAEVMKAINALQGSITMVVIAHRLSTVEGCDELIRVGEGGGC